MYLCKILFVYTSSAVNLFIYGLTNRQFRKEYIDLRQVTVSFIFTVYARCNIELVAKIFF